MNGSVHTYIQGVHHRHHLFHPSFLELFVRVCVFVSWGIRMQRLAFWCVQYGAFVYYMYYTPPLRNQGMGCGLEWMIQIYQVIYSIYIQLSTHHAPIYSRYNSIRQTPQPPALMLCKPPRYNNNNNTMHSPRQHPLSLSLSTSHGHPLRASIITEDASLFGSSCSVHFHFQFFLAGGSNITPGEPV